MVASSKNAPRAAILDGRHIDNVSLVAGKDNVVKHGLGRPFVSAIITPQSNANVWQDQTRNAQKANVILVQCSVDTVVSIWIY